MKLTVFIITVFAVFQGGAIAQTPIVCMTAPQRAELLDTANSIANIVDACLKTAGGAFKIAANRAKYTSIVDQIMTALRNGWSAPDVCDSIANPIADPLAVIPVVGSFVQLMVKTPIKMACDLRKQNLGC